MTLREQMNRLLREYSLDEELCLVVWGVDDVLHRAKDLGIPVTREEVSDILENMQQNHDATLGISWDTIDCYLDY